MVLKGGIQKDAGFWRRLLGGLGQLARQAGPVIGQGLQAFASADLNIGLDQPPNNSFLGRNTRQSNSILSSAFGGLKTQPIQSPDFQDLQTTSELLGKPSGNRSLPSDFQGLGNLQGGNLPSGFSGLDGSPVQRRPAPNQQAQFRQIPNSQQILGNLGVQPRIQAEVFPQQVNTQNAFAARQRQQQMLQAMAQAQQQAAIEHNMAMRRALARQLDETLRQRDFSLPSTATPEPTPTPTQQPIKLKVEKQGPVAPQESDLMKETRVRIFADAVQRQLSVAPRDASGNVIYRDIAFDLDVAPLVMYADVKHKARTGKLLTKEQLLKAAEAFGKGVFDFVIGDDINTLTDPTVNMWWKAAAALSIASNFGGGFVAKAGVRAITKSGKLLVGASKHVKVVSLGTATVPSKGGYKVFSQQLKKLGLNKKQIKRYEDFYERRGYKHKEIEVYGLPDGTKALTIKKGKLFGDELDPHSDSIIWEVYLEPKRGEVLLEGKRTWTNKGVFKHWHQKNPEIPGGKQYDFSEEVYDGSIVETLKKIGYTSTK